MMAVKHKIVFLGDICVGKTSLINRFIYDNFDNNYNATIGIDFLCKSVMVDNQTIRLQLWDTAGQERFRSLLPNYIRNSSIAVIVFDVTQRETFNDLEQWVNVIKLEASEITSIIIIGNKIDKNQERTVSLEEAQTRAHELQAFYLETSAKTRENIEDFFSAVIDYIPSQSPRKQSGIKLGYTKQEENSNKKCKC